MSTSQLPVPSRAEQIAAAAMVGSDERMARVAWALVLEIAAERPGHDRGRLIAEVESLGHLEAWHRLVGGDLPRSASARARVADVDVHAELSRAEKVGSRILVPGDREWPIALDHPLLAPHLLYVRGAARLDEVTARSVAVVGSRASTGYGEAVARDLGSGLASRGWSVASGLAYGIDGAAHLGALTGEGPCLAVLPCGPDQVYPQGHQRLADAVLERGLIITEQPCGRTAQRHRFLSRNRLIAGLSRAVVVVEAGLRSGSLNTAGWALKLGVPVAAVPGPVTSMASAGCHDWIMRDKARLVSDTDDVIALAAAVGDPDVLDIEVVEQLGPARPADALGQQERRLHDLLTPRKERTVGQLATELSLPVHEVLAHLGTMHLEGWAVQGEFGWCRGPGPATGEGR